MRPVCRVLVAVASLWVAFGPATGHAQSSFTNFESGHVRPLALSPDGSRLFAVNTPDNRLEIYTVSAGALALQAEVPVGLEPVAVVARSNTEVWVVNHLSDSVSIVQIDTVTPALSRVIRTLLTCDEPRDIVFAGTDRAFVTTARRGQNCPATVPASLTTAGTGRALVQVWDATSLGGPLGGTPIANIVLFGDTPRALAKSPDGTRVYAAAFQSGNRTTAITQTVVSGNGQGLPPDPVESAYPTPKPPVGLIVKFNTSSSTWKDERPTSNWNGAVPFTLPDRDVFIIDTSTLALASGPNTVVGVGTVLFNMAVRPNASGQIYVANTDARNEVRFEPRIPSTGGGVQGHIVESRITVINGTTPTARHLNPHITFACVPPGCLNNATEIEQSLAFPMDMQFSSNGSLLYVVGFGSEKVGIFDAAQLEAGTINAATKHLVEVGGGPSGLALDEAHNQLFVMNRFDDTISIVANANNPATATELTTVPLRFDPSTPEAFIGRRFLYDARHTSAHGDNACASCHIFGDFDSLAWDLSNPLDPNIVDNDNPFRLKPPAQTAADVSLGGDGVGIQCTNCVFHPMKGPMTTQTLRGMAPAGPMHWRGDRTGGTTGQDPLDEDLAFKAFNPAFVGLLGRDAQLTATEMQEFTDFMLSVVLPPNPIRSLDDVLANNTASESQGSTFFNNTAVDGGVLQCVFCHRNPTGTDGLSSFEGEPQEFKIAHLRNIYQKVGMFGSSGDQVRGFGFLHDGSVPTVFNFLQAAVFQFSSNTQRRNVEAFTFAFDTGEAPAVGQQVTVTASNLNDTGVVNRIALLIGRDDAGRCDLTVKGNFGGVARGWVYAGGNNFQPDRNADGVVASGTLRGQAATAGQELTYTCVPLGSGTRVGVDRDLDGTFDRREIDCGTDPANAGSTAPPTGPCGGTTTTTSTTAAPTTSSTSSSTSSSSSSSTSTSTSTTTTRPTTTSTLGATTSTTSSTTSTHTTSSTSSSSSSTSTSTSTSTTTTRPTTTSTLGATTSTTSTTTSTHTTSSTSSSSSSTSSSTSTTSSTTAGPTSTSTPTTSTSSTTTTTIPIVLVQSTALTLKDRSTAPADPNRRKIAFKSVTLGDAAPNQIAAPARGTSGDPTPGGASGGSATLDVYNSAGSGEKFTVVLPASGWTALDDSQTPRGYKFKSASPTDPITRVLLRGNLLRVRGGRAGWLYTLDEPSQGRVAVRFRPGTGSTWCAEAPAKASGSPPSTASNDRVDKFVGARRSAPPATCPAVP